MMMPAMPHHRCGSIRLIAPRIRGGFTHGWMWSVSAVFATTIVLLPLLGGIVLATTPAARFLAASGVKEVRYERSGCFGWCPAYSLTFGADGHARYEGGAFVAERGVFETAFAPRRFARFADALFRRGFFTARDQRVYLADAPSTTIVIAFKDGRTATTHGFNDVAGDDIADDLYAAGYFIDGFAVNLCGWHRVAPPAAPAPPGPFTPISMAPCRAGTTAPR